MSAAVMTNRLELSSVADTALKTAAQFWFAETVVGQVVFGLTVASRYALTALRGDCHKWNFTNGYVPSSSGNTAVVMHVASAAIVMLARAVQLVPQVRKRFPAFHRWNGRATYNFNEDELNNFRLRAHSSEKVPGATRILQLNVEAYPQSSKVYDSLGEAYADDGNKPLAIANSKIP